VKVHQFKPASLRFFPSFQPALEPKTLGKGIRAGPKVGGGRGGSVLWFADDEGGIVMGEGEGFQSSSWLWALLRE